MIEDDSDAQTSPLRRKDTCKRRLVRTEPHSFRAVIVEAERSLEFAGYKARDK